MYHIVIIFPDI